MKDKIIDIIALHSQTDEKIGPDCRLREDLDLNSMSMMMIVFEIEKLIGRELKPSEISGVKTVRDCLAAAGIKEG